MWLQVMVVTTIGVGIGLVAWAIGGRLIGPTVAGSVGAWGGFLVGTLLAAAVDTIAPGYAGRPVSAGYALAIAGAVVVTVREQQLATHAAPASRSWRAGRRRTA